MRSICGNRLIGPIRNDFSGLGSIVKVRKKFAPAKKRVAKFGPPMDADERGYNRLLARAARIRFPRLRNVVTPWRLHIPDVRP